MQGRRWVHLLSVSRSCTLNQPNLAQSQLQLVEKGKYTLLVLIVASHSQNWLVCPFSHLEPKSRIIHTCIMEIIRRRRKNNDKLGREAQILKRQFFGALPYFLHLLSRLFGRGGERHDLKAGIFIFIAKGG